MERLQKYTLPLIVGVLICVCTGIWYEALKGQEVRGLRIAFLNIGQGDSIFIESPTGTQVIVDGGPDSSLLRELTSVMNPFDRTIDAIIVTNPDQDHFAGFLNLLGRYDVGEEFEPGTKKTTVTYKALEKLLADKSVPRLLAKRGMYLDLGGGAVLQILYPDRDVYSLKPNDGSVVMKLIYGKTSVMLMGDATAFVESHISSLKASGLESNILKLGHHGSKTSSSQRWIEAVKPQEAIVSAGCNNKYGHPSREVTDRLAADKVPYLWTCKEGTIEFESDGLAWVRR